MPSYGQGVGTGSNLNVSISPLGLVELSDEEFEVHGVRLTRYANSWAMYLGMQWTSRREVGEPQVTYNYYRAFSDYLATFVFGRGVQFKSPIQTAAIVPSRLKRVWELDNDKRSVLWEMALQGGVSGDAFVKVAYEEPSDDPRLPPTSRRGKVRILVLNSQHVFPEWHPHDRTKFQRVKITYKFWGTAPEGTRQVFTYTEILEDNLILEYINDQLIRQNENPLGVIPVVHVANSMVPGSPWGLPDCYSIGDINREYNEKALELSDIINYHSAPITVITGAKANNLEKGAKKVWAIPTPGAEVKNLEMMSTLAGPIEFLKMIKMSMHEMVGVPESALGQMQPISNTSGVALSIQFQPLMLKWHAKVNQYAVGLEKINEYVLLTLFLKEPETLLYNPDTDGILDESKGQVAVLDPQDPITYVNEAYFPSPLPLDKVVLLQELQLKQALGLESRVGALQALGEEFPDTKLEEIRAERIDDAKADGAMSMLQTMIQKQIMDLTGIMPGPDGGELPPMQDGPTGADGVPGPATPQAPTPILDADAILESGIEDQIRTDLVTQAYGTKTPKRRSPTEDTEGEPD